MPDWTALEWLGVGAAMATIVGAAFTGYSLFRRTKGPNSQAQASSNASPGATVVAGSPHSTVVSNSPGATIVQGALSR